MTFIEVDKDDPAAKERDLAKAQEVVAGSVPLMPTAPDLVFDLQRGLFHGDTWHTEVEVRELNGVDEEALARFKRQEDFLDGVLVYGTVRIGSIELQDMEFADRQSILAQLLVGERDQIFIRISAATYGSTKEISAQCPAITVSGETCGTTIEAEISLTEDIKIPEMETPHTGAYSFTTSKGDVLQYRLVVGSDQLALFERRGATSAENNTFILSEVITKLNDKPIVNKQATARALSIGDRQRLLEEIVNKQPTPDTGFLVACPKCGWEGVIALSLGDIFRP